MPPVALGQDTWGGGIFRGRNAPADTVYDAIDALINDERELFRRGGSVFKSGSNADATLLGLWDGITVGGPRTFFWSTSSPYVLDTNDSSILDLGSVVPQPFSAGVEIGGLVFFRGGLVSNQETEVIYAGSRKTATYSTGTIAIADGSAIVTGTGTSWVANADPGMLLRFQINNGSFVGVVKTVDSNTQLTLVDPSVLTASGIAYDLLPIVRYELEDTGGTALLPANPTTAAHAVAGQRLLRCRDNRMYFSARRDDREFLKFAGISYPVPVRDAGTDYHELPKAALITGADSLQDTAILFTTGGVWVVANLVFDLFDAAGNVQHQIRQINQDVVLWGEAGIVGWAGALIVPAIDDVYVFTLDGAPVPVSEYVRPLYRSYVEAGYKPGLATVYRAHYTLPILDGSNNLIDTLVCRLDLSDSRGSRRPGWTRWANHARGGAYATRVGASTRSPKLLGINGLRVTELTQGFSPSATYKADADGTNHAEQIVTRDFVLPGRRSTVTKVRAEYELIDAASDNPTTTMEYAVGPEGSSFTALTAQRGGIEDDGTGFSRWRVGKRADRVRFRFTTVGPAARAILRRIGVEVSGSGRQ